MFQTLDCSEGGDFHPVFCSHLPEPKSTELLHLTVLTAGLQLIAMRSKAFEAIRNIPSLGPKLLDFYRHNWLRARGLSRGKPV